MMTRLLADLFSLDLESQENKNGSMGVAELYGHIMNVRVFGFENLDPALALERRLVAQEGARVLSSTTADVIKRLPSSSGVGKELVAKAKGIVSKIPLVGRLVGEEGHGSKDQSKAGSLRWYGYNVAKEMLAAGKSTEEVADISWMNAVGGVGATIGVVSTSPPTSLPSRINNL